jgi:phospholipase C
MFSAKMLLFWVSLVCTAAFLGSLGGCGGGSTKSQNPPPSTQKIQHVVVIFQENRTPDNLFQDPILIGRQADIQNFGVNSKGQVIQLTPTVNGLVTDYDLNHGHPSFVAMYDGGKMDGADLIRVDCPPHQPLCGPPNPWFQYVDPSKVQPYFRLAETYTFADRMFQTNQGPSFPAHQFIISGTSAPTATSDLFAAENPNPIPGIGQVLNNTGCTAPPDEVVRLIAPSGIESSAYPCYDHPTLTDLLNGNSISWRYYAPSAGSIWTAPNAIQHMCVPNLPPPNGTLCTGADWTGSVVLDQKQVLKDISGGQLANVSWVIPNGFQSDHALINDGSGPSWVASIVNSIGNSPYWANTAIIITWDDWGGWYDHVAPPIAPAPYNAYEYGFRVPMIVVSPYAKPAHISHVQHDFGSILKFIETAFNLPTVAAGYADARADDLSDCFDYNQTPLVFHTVAAPLSANDFLRDTRPPVDPDDD